MIADFIKGAGRANVELGEMEGMEIKLAGAGGALGGAIGPLGAALGAGMQDESGGAALGAGGGSLLGGIGGGISGMALMSLLSKGKGVGFSSPEMRRDLSRVLLGGAAGTLGGSMLGGHIGQNITRHKESAVNASYTAGFETALTQLKVAFLGPLLSTAASMAAPWAATKGLGSLAAKGIGGKMVGGALGALNHPGFRGMAANTALQMGTQAALQ